MKKIKPFSMVLTILFLNFFCSDSVVEKIQKFKPNVPPEIIVFTSDSPGGATLLPNQTFHVHVEASDPNGNKITYKYDSALGAFSGQFDKDKMSDVVYTLPGVLNAGFTAIVRVTVTDEKGASTSQDLNLGSGKLGPQITLNSTGTSPFLVSSTNAGALSNGGTQCSSFSWTADADGFFQVRFLTDPALSCSMDTSINGNFKFYSKGTPVNVTVHGPGATCPALPNSVDINLTNGTVNNDQVYKVCVGVRDALAQDSFVGGTSGYPFTLDNTPPSSTTPTINNASIINGQVFTSQQSIVFNCVDALSPCNDLMYTSSYSPTPTPAAATAPVFTTSGTNALYTANASQGIVFGNNGDGSYEVRVISRDNAGNIEPVTIFNFAVNSALPVISAAAPTKAAITTTGDTVNFGTSDIVWSANEGGNFAVVINPVSTTAPCGVNDTTSYANFAAITNSTGLGNSGPYIPGIGATVTSTIKAAELAAGINNVYVCVHDGFSYSWISKQIFKDDTAPLFTMTPLLGGATYTMSQGTVFSCTDSSACRISYTQDYLANTKTAPAGIAPNFAGSGTVVNGPASANILFGNLGDGTYTVKYVSQDAVGNPPALTVKTETFSVNNVTPVINLAGTPTNAIVTTTGDTVTYGTSNITWNSTDNGTYIVMINAACPAAWPGDTAALVQAYAGAGKSTGTNNSGSLTANANITSTILATDLTLEGANIIRLCTNDGFSTVEKAVTINRDNTKPVTAMSPNLNNLSFAGSQSVTFNCSDANGCYGIAYTEAMLPISGGAFPAVTVPSFTATTTPATNIALGNTSGPVTLGATNAQKYTTAFISKDVVGNTEIFAALVNQAQYNIDSTLPQVTKVSGPTNAFITTTLNGVQTSSVTWSANKSGTYYVNINRACTASTNSTGAGNTAAYTLGTSGNITSTFVATDAAFTPGNNTINICLWDPVLSTWGVLPINVNVDNTAPVVAYTPNINGIFTTPQSITFSCTDVSGAGCVSMRYTTGFTANSSTAPAVTAPVYTSPTADAGTGTLITGTSGLASVGGSGDGTYKVMYIGRDSVGNVAAAGSLVFYVNQTSPSITYVSGPSNAAVTTTGNTASFGSSDIVWKANEAGQTYLIYINTACPATWPGGTAVPASPTTTNITTTVNASSLLAGANTVNICLNDGFVTTSMAKSIYRDDTAPVSAGTVPAATYTTAQNVTFSCTDNVSCSAISYTVAYNAHSAVAPAAITPNFAGTGTVINGASGNVVLGNQGDGTYTVSRISKDSVGNVEAPVSFSFSVDGTQPLITPSPTFTPTQATVTTTGSTIAFFGTTYQSTAITWSTNQPSSYYVKVNALCSTTTLGTSNAAGTNVSGTIAASTNVTTTINASAAVPWLAGANTIRICAFDGFTTASSSATVNLDNTAPAIAPAITLTSLGSTSATFNITGGTTDTVYYDYSTNGTTWSTPGIYAATPSFTASGLTAGTAYTLSVRFYDAVGNIGPTTTMNFTPGYTVTVTATNIPAVTAGNELKFTLSTSGQVLTFPAAGGSGTLTFTARLANAVSFNVATTQPGITPASICSFTDNAWGTIASADKILNVNCVSGYQYARTIAPSNPTGNRPMTTDSLYTSDLVTGQGTVFGLAKVGNVLYFTVQGTHQVKSVNLTTKAVALVAGSGLAGHVDGTGAAAYFNDPRSITTDGSNLYVAEYSGNYIRKINITTGAVTTLAGTGTNTSTDNANSLLGTVGGPVGIDMWGNNLVFEEYNFHKVRKINLTTGQLSTIAGTGVLGYADNATGTLAQFNQPHAITVDSINNAAYVADASNHRIRKVDLTTNAVTTVAGSGVAGLKDGVALQAQLNGPFSLTVYQNKLLIVDNNQSLRVLNLTTGIVSTISNGSGFTGNVIGAADDARYNSNGSILVSDNGDVIYFADANNGAIRSISNQLAAQFTFDDAGAATAKDFSGNFKDATIYNAPTAAIDENGTANGAYSFNGINQYIKTASPVSIKTSNFTYSIWVNPASTVFQAILENGSSYNVAIFFKTGGNIGVYTSTNAYIITSTAIPINKWTHIALRNNAGTWELFINGISVGTNATATMGIPNSTTIGAAAGGGIYYFNGKISEVRMYERPLTNREIKRLGTQVPEGLVRYYPMDGDITDATIFQKHGTIPSRTGGSLSAATLDVDRFNNGSATYKFDGTDDYIYAPDTNLPGRTAAQTTGGKAPRTVCTWLKTGNAATSQGIFNYGTNITNQLYALDLWASQYFHVGWSANYQIGNPRTSEWTHVCTTYDGTNTAAIYENGALLGSSTVASTWDTVLNGTIYLGYEPGDLFYLNGNLDDFKIYGKVLSADEIASLAEPSGIALTTTTYSGSDGYIKHGILPGSLQTFKLAATANNIYNIWWDDSVSGSGTTTANVTVSASYFSSGTAIFTNIDSAYLNSAVQRFKATATDTVLITVNNPGTSTGVYGIKANEFANLSFTNATALATQLYTTTVVAGKTYSIWWDDAYCGVSCSGTRTLDIVVSASGQGANATTIDSGYTTPYTFTATGTGTVTITVRAFNTAGGTGTFGLMVTKP